MRIVIQEKDTEFEIKTSSKAKIKDIKERIQEKKGYNVLHQKLFFSKKKLDDNKTLLAYSIKNNSKIKLKVEITEGMILSNEKSPIHGYINESNQIDIEKKLLDPYFVHDQQSSEFVRNTNTTKVYYQQTPNCFSLASSSAYTNTINRIPCSRKKPTFEECYNVANYNKGNGGKSILALQKLEEKFKFGILFEELDDISIECVFKDSVIAIFSTSKNGYACVENGELLKFQDGDSDGLHATLVEGYNFEKDCFICKNTWESGESRFYFIPSACHSCKFIRVYFTDDSLKAKNMQIFRPRMELAKGIYKNQQVACALMDEQTSIYCNQYVAIGHSSQDQSHCDLNYIGVDIKQWIDLNRSKKDYDTSNNEKKRLNSQMNDPEEPIHDNNDYSDDVDNVGNNENKFAVIVGGILTVVSTILVIVIVCRRRRR